MSDSKKPSQRSSDFRYIPCDTISLAINNSGIKLILGVEEVDASVTELMGAHMTHKTAMILKSALAKGLEEYQQESGIKFEEPKLNSVSKVQS
ncbi:hypothetical protein [Thalassospira povalilytica]|uniref:hypothetical protein n=1 Tax=Thalassospira povalilytica TaxID=732237 RepID=UPI001D1851C6|nr:hypothetical protein [Thalassospira povalilytica]MCC4241974.1 hypothetical protein [Thalassospira povalilytica]